MEKFSLAKENVLLVIVDIQERLVAAMIEKDRVIANTKHLLEAAKLLNFPLLVTEQYPKGLGPTVQELNGRHPPPTRKPAVVAWPSPVG